MFRLRFAFVLLIVILAAGFAVPVGADSWCYCIDPTDGISRLVECPGGSCPTENDDQCGPNGCSGGGGGGGWSQSGPRTDNADQQSASIAAEWITWCVGDSIAHGLPVEHCFSVLFQSVGSSCPSSQPFRTTDGSSASGLVVSADFEGCYESNTQNCGNAECFRLWRCVCMCESLRDACADSDPQWVCADRYGRCYDEQCGGLD